MLVRSQAGARARSPSFSAGHQRARARACRVAASGGGEAAVAAALSLLLSQSEGSPSLYAATDATAGAVRTLAASQRGAGAPAAGAAAWDGCWEVFYAPHMRSVEALARFRPVRYVLSGGGTHMRSDVGYSFAGAAGWLSAEGDVVPRAEGGVDVLLRDFWVEPLSTGADAPLPPPRPENPISGGARVSALDALINAVGRAGFIPSLSVFPVQYLDADVCVFEFPPLRTVIAARRVSTSPPQQLLPPAA